MPTKSDAQRRLMYAVLNSKKLSKEKDIPQSLAREFLEADRRKR